MNGLVHFFFSATGALVWLFTAVLWIARRPRSIAARRTLLTVAAMYALASIYAVPALAARALSAGYAPFTAADAPRGKTAIVVLGSGSVLIEGWDANLRLDLMTSIEAARVLEAWRVYCLISPDLVISWAAAPTPTTLPSRAARTCTTRSCASACRTRGSSSKQRRRTRTTKP